MPCRPSCVISTNGCQWVGKVCIPSAIVRVRSMMRWAMRSVAPLIGFARGSGGGPDLEELANRSTRGPAHRYLQGLPVYRHLEGCGDIVPSRDGEPLHVGVEIAGEAREARETGAVEQ